MTPKSLQEHIVKAKLILGRENLSTLFANYLVGKLPRKTAKGAEMPSRLVVEPTNLCTLECPACPTGNGSSGREPSVMPLEIFKSIVKQVENHAISIALFNHGEPFLNENLTKMISYASKRRIWIETSTNGISLKEKALANDIVRSKLQYLVVRLDGGSQKTLEKFRKNTSFEDIVDGIRNVMDAKKKYHSITPFIEIQFVLMKHNFHEINRIKEIAQNLGVYKLVIKNVDISLLEPDFMTLVDSVYPDSSLRERTYRDEQGEYHFKKPHSGKCPFLYKSPVISANGDVIPCCYDLESEYIMGNVYTSSTLDEIWNGQVYQRFRSAFIDDPQSIPICDVCPVGRASKLEATYYY